MARPISAPVVRRSFSRLETPLEAPHLIDIQRRSFEDLTDPEHDLDLPFGALSPRLPAA